MKKGKVVLAQPAAGARMLSPRPPMSSRAPGPVRGGGEEAAYRASLRHRGLLQDYQELVKETEAKKRSLYMIKLRKQRLWAEIKFLRKRYKSMSQNPSQTVVCKVRNPPMPPPVSRTSAWADDVEHRLVPAVGSSSKSQPMPRRQLGPPRACPVIDLNETCEPSHEVEMVEHYGYVEPLGISSTKRYPMEGDGAAGPSDVRMPAFWNIGNPAVRAEKRKISWQDQLALRV
ncbi:hypothetical protein EJB05_08682 [Eragrostis curvula]|uniref:Uncharacterized protein n=1 Tax=Eragrostis curvula TaxID=38414 RepID=A0A5J9W310_9POAL|nr:hypothetical protein EJB05_08682 [Eragrostis curvula]